MRKTTGHIIRISGLVIEMLGIWGVFRASGDTDQPRIQLPGGTTIAMAWIAVGLGFVVWLTGTILVYAPRSRQKPVPKDQRNSNPDVPESFPTGVPRPNRIEPRLRSFAGAFLIDPVILHGWRNGLYARE